MVGGCLIVMPDYASVGGATRHTVVVLCICVCMAAFTRRRSAQNGGMYAYSAASFWLFTRRRFASGS